MSLPPCLGYRHPPKCYKWLTAIWHNLWGLNPNIKPTKHTTQFKSKITFLLQSLKLNSRLARQQKALFQTTSLARKGNMFAKQVELPHLPVPSLQQSLSKYLVAVRCLVEDNDFNKTKRIAEEFGKEGGIGKMLQEKLIERSRVNVNWVSISMFWQEPAVKKCMWTELVKNNKIDVKNKKWWNFTVCLMFDLDCQMVGQ